MEENQEVQGLAEMVKEGATPIECQVRQLQIMIDHVTIQNLDRPPRGQMAIGMEIVPIIAIKCHNNKSQSKGIQVFKETTTHLNFETNVRNLKIQDKIGQAKGANRIIAILNLMSEETMNAQATVVKNNTETTMDIEGNRTLKILEMIGLIRTDRKIIETATLHKITRQLL